MGCCALSLCRQGGQSPLLGQGTRSAAVPDRDPYATWTRVPTDQWDAGEEAGVSDSCSPTLHHPCTPATASMVPMPGARVRVIPNSSHPCIPVGG